MQKGIPLSVTLALILSSLLPAQTEPAQTGSLQGRVEDVTGTPIPEARVTLIHRATQAERRTSADEIGHFELGELPLGGYLLKVRARGFEDVQVPVRIGVKPGAPVRIRLEVATLTEQVTVTGSATPVASAQENADVFDIRESLFERLPVKEADLLAVPSLFLDQAATGSTGPQVIVDGMESDNLDLPASSIKRIYVNKNPYSAEFGRPGRGRLEVITKDGSRHHFHRNLMFVLHNSALDARNAFARVRPPSNRALFEGEFDGPLAGEKATFLVGGRYFRYRDNGVITAETPLGREVENFETPEHGGRLFSRLDWRVAPTHTLRTYYRFSDDTKQNRGVGGFNLAERAMDVFGREQRITVSETAVLSPSFSNDLRVSFRHERDATNSLTDRPAIIVLDAFSSGGAQVSSRQQENSFIAQEIANYVRGDHTLRFGGQLRFRRFRSLDASNFGGTFTFSSLSSFNAGRPFLFTVNQGAPEVPFGQDEFYSFVQDEIRVRPDLSVSLGLRHELQSNLSDYNNLAPRVALAYAPAGSRTVLRAGAGVFYEHQSKTLQEQSLLYDGFRIRQAVISNPGFPLPFDTEAVVRFPSPSVVRIAPDMRDPYLVEGSLGVERRLGVRRNYVAVEYTTIRGLKLYRMRNINAPLPATGQRADPNFLNIKQFESSGMSRSNALRLSYQGYVRRFEVLASYTLSRSSNDTGGLFSLPADNFNLHSEYGRSDFDARHRLNLLGTARLPMRFQLGAIAQWRSSLPFNITTGFDDNHDTVANDRPTGIPRNTGHGPGFANVDVRLSKRIDVGSNDRAPRLDLQLDAFNLFNHVNYRTFIGTLSSPFFGRANAAYPGRQMQVSLKLKF